MPLREAGAVSLTAGHDSTRSCKQGFAPRKEAGLSQIQLAGGSAGVRRRNRAPIATGGYCQPDHLQDAELAGADGTQVLRPLRLPRQHVAKGGQLRQQRCENNKHSASQTGTKRHHHDAKIRPMLPWTRSSVVCMP